MTREVTDERCPRCGSELMMYGEDKLCSDVGGAGRFLCLWNSWGGQAVLRRPVALGDSGILDIGVIG